VYNILEKKIKNYPLPFTLMLPLTLSAFPHFLIFFSLISYYRPLFFTRNYPIRPFRHMLLLLLLSYSFDALHCHALHCRLSSSSAFRLYSLHGIQCILYTSSVFLLLRPNHPYWLRISLFFLYRSSDFWSRMSKRSRQLG
jgi:hypothetical protein